MAFFAVLAAGFLATAFVRPKVVGTEAFKHAMTVFFAAAILHDFGRRFPFVGLVAARSDLGLGCGASMACAWRWRAARIRTAAGAEEV